MNLTSPAQVRSWCLENGFHPNKVLGQNFLIDKNTLDAILDAARLPPGGCRILEIGPGLGVLTEGLLSRGCRVTAVEKDPVLAERLAGALGSPQALETIEGDALDLAKAGSLDGFPALVSNLPYQAGTRIVLEMARRNDVSPAAAPESMTVLVQTEVAERLAAGPGSRTRCLAGTWVQLDYSVSVVRAVKASCFWPRPAVGSSVVRLERHHLNDGIGPGVRATFRSVAKQAFNHRRKQLGTIFRGIVESGARPEQLSVEDWLGLAAAWPQEPQSP